MIDSLIGYTKENFEIKKINGSFEVYDVHDDNIPPFLDGQTANRKYVVCTDASDKESEEKLKSFLRKEIIRLYEHLIWFEGDPLDSPITIKVEINKLKKHVELPKWLDNFIFNTYRATCQKDNTVSSNKYNSHIKNLNYLGRYFPRSFAESFCIFENILSCKPINSIYREKSSLKILSVGCGTGGDAIGIIQIAKKILPRLEEIELVALDINTDATSILEKIIEKAEDTLQIKITTTFLYCDFINNGFSLEKIENKSFDIIITSKMINELISEQPFIPYYHNFLSNYSELLSEDGFLIISDVTVFSKETRYWYPELLNNQVNQFLSNNANNFSCLIPICCGSTYCKCSRCYSQVIFYVSHSRKRLDESKIAYKVIVRKSFYDKIGLDIKNVKYKISDTEKYCKNNNQITNRTVDAFDITNGLTNC